MTLTKVERAIALVEAVDPDWYEKVSVEDLDLEEPFAGILGQVLGSFVDGLIAIRGDADLFEGIEAFVWNRHRAEWVAHVEARMAGSKVSSLRRLGFALVFRG